MFSTIENSYKHLNNFISTLKPISNIVFKRKKTGSMACLYAFMMISIVSSLIDLKTQTRAI